MENNIELQEMRDQLASFKQQLAGQKIINDRLMRKAMSEKASKIASLKNTNLIMSLFAIFIVIPTFHFQGFPPYLTLYMLFLAIYDGAMTALYHNKVDKTDFMNGDLKNVVTELKNLRKKYRQWYWIAIPQIIILIILLYHSFVQMNFRPELVRMMMICAGIGITIGSTMGILMNNKVISLCDDIIKDIESC